MTLPLSRNAATVDSPSGEIGDLRNNLTPNLLLNSNFDVWQRPTPITVVGGGAYAADRWMPNAGTGQMTVSQQGFAYGQGVVPNEPTYFIRLNQTTTPGTQASLEQRIESVRTAAGKNVTVSFWAKADSARSVTLLFNQYFGSGGSGSFLAFTQNFNLTTTFQRYSATGFIPSISGKTIGSGDYLQFAFTLPNSTFTIDFAQFMMTEGSIVMPWRNAGIAPWHEGYLCQRYFRILDVAPGVAVNGTTADFDFVFSPEMRTAPSLSLNQVARISDVAASDFTQSGLNSSYTTVSLRGARIRLGNFSGLTAFRPYLITNSSGTVYFFDAEL